MCGPADRRSRCAASDQDVAGGSGRRAGRKREAAKDGGKEPYLWNSARRRNQSVIANLYINRMLKGWRKTKRGEQFQARIINYADDCVPRAWRRVREEPKCATA